MLGALLLAGCAKGGTHRAAGNGNDLRPTFPVATTATNATAASGASSGSATSPTTGGPQHTPRATAAGATVTTSAASAPGATAPVITASITDRVGDATPSVLDKPPAWADLAGGTLTRTNDGFELRVKLGGAVPAKTDDENHTMNIASFYDVDGDGNIDYEVWANISSDGWGGSWFDDVHHKSAYGTDAGVTWTPDGNELVMRFPLDHIAAATKFRWSLASEWGRYDVLSTPASVRDDAPDDNQPAAFG